MRFKLLRFILIITVIILVLCVLLYLVLHKKPFYELNVVHFGDFLSKFEETTFLHNLCREGEHCDGGFPRLYTAVERLKNETNFMLFSSGNTLSGSPYYTKFKWNISQLFMSELPLDAITVGSKDFIEQINRLLPFLERINKNVVISNMDNRNEPNLNNMFNKSAVIARGGKKIGVIGIFSRDIAEKTPNVGRLTFNNYAYSANKIARQLIQDKGVFTSVLLSQAGYLTDLKEAKDLDSSISIIIGGHSGTFLATGVPPYPKMSEGPYPTVVKSRNGKNILVVHAYAHGKILGHLKVLYSKNGHPHDWEGKPIYISNKIPKNPMMQKMLESFKGGVAEGSAVIGEATRLMPHKSCYYEECAIGNLFADSLKGCFGKSTKCIPEVALISPKALDGDLQPGNITENDIDNIVENDITVCIKIKGKSIKKLLNKGVSHELCLAKSRMLQISGGTYTVNRNALEVVQVNIGGTQLDEDKIYTAVVTRLMAFGKSDDFIELNNNKEILQYGPMIQECLFDLVKAGAPIKSEEEGRITIN